MAEDLEVDLSFAATSTWKTLRILNITAAIIFIDLNQE
jgi:hypothetical protein